MVNICISVGLRKPVLLQPTLICTASATRLQYAKSYRLFTFSLSRLSSSFSLPAHAGSYTHYWRLTVHGLFCKHCSDTLSNIRCLVNAVTGPLAVYSMQRFKTCHQGKKTTLFDKSVCRLLCKCNRWRRPTSTITMIRPFFTVSLFFY